MAIWRTLAWFYIFVVFTFVIILSPFVRSSTPCLEGGRKVTESAAITEKEIQSNPGRGGNGASSGLAVEDSAREVPTGPDPLHHHDNPSAP